jgi:hypothetical protein
MDIQASVGRNATNNFPDVRVVQLLLQQNMGKLGPVLPVSVTGICDSGTIILIEMFQRNVMDVDPPTGRVDPNSPTWFELNETCGPSTPVDPTLQLTLDALRTEFTNFAQRFIQDKDVRAEYMQKASGASDEILDAVKRGEVTPAEGAAQANAMRNGLLDAGRLKSSDIGRAVAESEKASGLTMDELIAKYSEQLFHKEFSTLGTAEQDAVFLKIIERAGQPNPKWNRVALQLGEAGKGLIIISIALSVYSVATSDRPGREAVKQGTGAGMGFLGSLAGGAAAGLVCGPGAPICVGVGAFVGGLVFVVGSDFAFDEVWE